MQPLHEFYQVSTNWLIHPKIDQLQGFPYVIVHFHTVDYRIKSISKPDYKNDNA
jgi:hypothetical protein